MILQSSGSIFRGPAYLSIRFRLLKLRASLGRAGRKTTRYLTERFRSDLFGGRWTSRSSALLVAFVVKTSNASWTAPRLRHTLRANLPLHMVPSRIVFLDSLPHNSGHKIDREALRQFPLTLRDGNKGDEPRTETEMLLADI